MGTCSSSATQSAGLSAAFTTRWRALNNLRVTPRVAAISVASLAVAWIAGAASGAHSQVEAWSTGTAYAAFFLLAISLVLGPLRVIRGQNNPVHNAMRRDVGISAGVAGIVHTVLGLQVHMRGELRKYFTAPLHLPLTAYSFVAANWLGLLSALVLLGLVTISNNIAIRAIGLGKWKRLQRIAYVAAIAAIAHGIMYQVIEKRATLVVTLVTVVAIAVTVLQLAGWRVASRQRNTEAQ